MMSRCSQCGTELPEQYRFCPNCGAPQEPVAGSPPPVEACLTGPGAIAQQGGVAAGAAEDWQRKGLAKNSFNSIAIGSYLWTKHL
jgi:hypothetical protein